MFKKMRNLCITLGILVALLFLVFLAATVDAAVDKVHIRAATNVAPTDLMAMTMEHYLKLMKEKSQGRITYEYHPSGSLGSMREVHEAMRANAVQMYSGTVGDLSGYDQLCNISAFPYIYNDVDHGNRVWEKLGPEFFDALAKRAGWRVLYTWIGAPRDLTTKKPVTEPSQLAGLKIRIPEFAIFVTLWKKYFKATPTVIPFGELYTAMKTGVVDAQENPVYRTLASGLFEVNPCLIRTAHVFDINDVRVSEKFWQDLSPGLQKIFIDAAAETRQWTINENKKNMYQSIGESVIKYRINVIEPNLEAFRKTSLGIEDDFPFLKDTVTKIRSIK